MKENEYKLLLDSLIGLERYVRARRYSGYDPYDALNSKYIRFSGNKYLYLAATQFFVYSPINLRTFFKVEQGVNPKALGLFLQAYCNMFRAKILSRESFESIYLDLVDLLIKCRSDGYSGDCWGFNFDWQDLTRYSKKGLPTIVITSFIANAFLDLYDITLDKDYLQIAESSCDFILNDLNTTINETGICFSYTPIDRHIVHNANLLGAALLARMYSLNKRRELLDHSERAFNFSLPHQRKSGAWAYSINEKQTTERDQIDFHQGFILDCLSDFIKYANPDDSKYSVALQKGADFYQFRQFDDRGCSKWRWPRRWPVDIHNQAQGIITFSKIFETTGERAYLEFAGKIALWTINNLKGNSGYFYHQKWPLFTNKISYMRWGQAWMMLALSEYVQQKELVG